MGYLGSKAASGAYQAIISQMPPHDTYIETHLGGGAIMLKKPPAPLNIGIDIDYDALIDFAFTHNLPHVSLVNTDAVDYLDFFDFSRAGRVLIYADPPYLASTRTSNARYRHEYTDDDHRKLIAKLRNVPANVMISGYPSALYDDLLSDWRSIQFQVMTRGGPRTEQLWMNFPEQAAYSAAYAGTDYIDRQRIKRKAERWAAKYRELPPGEQLAILTEMLKGNS
ncbi:MULTISPECIES: DNA adenine methylase [unclassified Serratia (in: enterobacteria)]|uniref:DNA adenine methylase n=1 Tax=unclassified Serratia (in: enterobacteria) TaxID=2647522 RepID=UPI00307671CB